MKRFYEDVSVAAVGDGYHLLLDGRPVKTPMREALSVWSRGLADMIAAEWQAQGDELDPASMPMTGLANAAIDQISPDLSGAVDDIARFLGTDYLCYLSDEPSLKDRQLSIWTPYHAWFEAELKAPLVLTSGVMPVDQTAALLVAFKSRLQALSAFELTGLKEITGLLGSAILGYAQFSKFRDQTAIWLAGDVDRLVQKEKWGADPEAEALSEKRRKDYEDACVFLDHSQGGQSSIH